MGGCFSTEDPPRNLASTPSTTSSTTTSASANSSRPMSRNPEAFIPDIQGAAQSREHLPTGLKLEQELQESLLKWQQEHDNQSTQLQQLMTLQSQEITKLREQVIDLQAHRQQQQIQYQRAVYIKTQMFPSANTGRMSLSQDCCAAAMACSLAIDELKADLKTEGQLISKQLEALSSSGGCKSQSLVTKAPFASSPTFASVSPPEF